MSCLVNEEEDGTDEGGGEGGDSARDQGVEKHVEPVEGCSGRQCGFCSLLSHVKVAID